MSPVKSLGKSIIAAAGSVALALALGFGSSSVCRAQSGASDYCDANRPACVQAMNELDSVDASQNFQSDSGVITPKPLFVACWNRYVTGMRELAKLYKASWQALVAKGMSVNTAKTTAIQKYVTPYRTLSTNYNLCYSRPEPKLK